MPIQRILAISFIFVLFLVIASRSMMDGDEDRVVVELAPPTDTPRVSQVSPAHHPSLIVVDAKVSHSLRNSFTKIALMTPIGNVTSVRIEPIDTRSALRLKRSDRRGKGTGMGARLRHLHFLCADIPAEKMRSTRKMYIDLGARFYLRGSYQWFQKHYPQFTDFAAYYVFELLDLEGGYPRGNAKFHYIRKAAWTHSDGVIIKGMKMARVMEGHAMKSLQDGADRRPEWRIPSVDMDAFVRNISSVEDYVILKMDIEGGEWDLLEHMYRRGTFQHIDELFLECHSLTETASVHSPMGQDCIDLINSLRKLGVYCHNWF